MSAAPVTEAHRALVFAVRGYTVSHEQAAQAIADSEARAVAQQTEALALMIIRCNQTEKERDEALERLQPLIELVERHTLESEDSFETEDVLLAHYEDRDRLRVECERLRKDAADYTQWIACKMLQPEWDSFKKSLEVIEHWKQRAEKSEAGEASLRAELAKERARLFHLFHHESPMAQPGDTLADWCAAIDAEIASTATQEAST